MKELFSKKKICTVYKRGRNLKEIISPSLYPIQKKEKASNINSCDKCDICKNYLVRNNTFTCKVTGKHYYVRGNLNCNTANVIYMVCCKKCGKQYVGSAINFKARFRIHKSDIKNKMERCGTARHFNNKCIHSSDPHGYLQVQLIEHISNANNIEDVLWEREKYWQCQLFCNTHGMNSIADIYSKKRKGCRKS